MKNKTTLVASVAAVAVLALAGGGWWVFGHPGDPLLRELDTRSLAWRGKPQKPAPRG